MEKRKFDSKKRYCYALIIAILIFTLGFFVVHSINYIELKRVSVLQEKTFYNFYKSQIDSSLFNKNKCEKEFIENLGYSIDFQGLMLTQIESKLGKENKKVGDNKKYYYLLELSHFDFMKNLNKDCDFNYNFILFFYSNEKDYLSKSEEIGRLLVFVRENNPNVLLYSFDSNSQDDLIINLKQKYNVTEPIAILINEKTKILEMNNVKDIEKYFS